MPADDCPDSGLGLADRKVGRKELLPVNGGICKSITAGCGLVKEYALRQATTESSVREFPYIRRVGDMDLMGDTGASTVL